MKFEEQLIFEAYNNAILNEGGAAGHMYHPFDLPEVVTLDDLVEVMINSRHSITESCRKLEENKY